MDMVIECWRPLALISTAVTVTAGRPQDFAVGFRGLWAEGFEHRAAGADAPALPCVYGGNGQYSRVSDGNLVATGNVDGA